MTNNINNFESMMMRLRTIADTMENDDVTLAESLKLFEEGMDLGKECRGILSSVEVRVNEIKEQAKRVGIDPATTNTPPNNSQLPPSGNNNGTTINPSVTDLPF